MSASGPNRSVPSLQKRISGAENPKVVKIARSDITSVLPLKSSLAEPKSIRVIILLSSSKVPFIKIFPA